MLGSQKPPTVVARIVQVHDGDSIVTAAQKTWRIIPQLPPLVTWDLGQAWEDV